MSTRPRTVVHVGCGPQRIADVHPAFGAAAWREIRVDADAAASPDIVASMTDLSRLAAASADAVFSSHAIEHLYAHEVPLALREFHRVLRADGFLLLTCPDLQEICRLVAEDRLLDAAYVSPAGPIAPIDMLYGHRASLAAGQKLMAHRCGFTAKVLASTLQTAGFAAVFVARFAKAFSLWAFASRAALGAGEVQRRAREFFPA